MTEQFKLVTNAQESKICKSNVTTIMIKCSNNGHGDGRIVWKLPTQAWNKAKISPYTPQKTALHKLENHSTNNAFWLVESRDADRLDNFWGYSSGVDSVCQNSLCQLILASYVALPFSICIISNAFTSICLENQRKCLSMHLLHLVLIIATIFCMGCLTTSLTNCREFWTPQPS